MERQSSSDSERTISDNERVGLSERSERKRKWEEGTTSTGFGSGPAGKHHLRFSITTTTHIDIDLQSPNVEQQQREVRNQVQTDKAHNQAGPRKPGREVRLFGVNIAGDQRMDEKSKETAFNFFKEAELNSYHEGYQKPLDERSVKEAIAVAMYEVIIDKCFKNNEQDLIQPFLREVRQLDLYKQAYGRKKSSFQQQEGPHFEEDREKLPKQKPTSPSWSHEGEKRQSHQAWEKEKKEVIDISSHSDSEADHGRTDHQADISRAREEHIKKVIDGIMKNKEKFTRKDIKQYLEDHQFYSTDSVGIATKHLQKKWSRYQRSTRYNNIIFAINDITY